MAEFYEIVTHGTNTTTGEEVKNVYFYGDYSSVPPTYAIVQEIAAEFEDTVMTGVLNILHSSYVLNTIEVTHWGGVQWVVQSAQLPNVGLRGDVGAVPFLAVPFQLLKLTKATKNGAKRYGPLRRDDFAAKGEPTTVALVDFLDGLAVKLKAFIDLPVAGFPVYPLIMGKWINKVRVDNPNPIVDASWGWATSQGSRKINVGS